MDEVLTGASFTTAAGIKQIIIPQQNEADLEDLPADVRDLLVFPVATLDEVFAITLLPETGKRADMLTPVGSR